MASPKLPHIDSNPQDALNNRFFSDALLQVIDQTIEQIRIANEVYIRACNESHLRALDSLQDYMSSLREMDQSIQKTD